MTIAGKIRVLLVEDHTLVRQGLRSALEAYPNIEVVGEAADGEVAVLNALKLQPAAIVMDINMPGMDGIAATRVIKKQSPQIAVVGLSVDPKDYQIYAMEKAGAFKVLNKDSAVPELYAALQEAVAAVRPILVIEEPSVEKMAVKDSGAKPENLHPTDAQIETK
jgi:DNA-binding NarL/FixJ family response regulator